MKQNEQKDTDTQMAIFELGFEPPTREVQSATFVQFSHCIVYQTFQNIPVRQVADVFF